MVREWNEIICKLIYRFVETNFKECDQRLKEEIFTLEFNDGEKTIINLRKLFPLNSTFTSLETNYKESRFLQFVTKEAPLDY